jgi:hypothetical protein
METVLHLRSSASICGSCLSFTRCPLPFPGTLETMALRVGGLGDSLRLVEAGQSASGAFGSPISRHSASVSVVRNRIGLPLEQILRVRPV